MPEENNWKKHRITAQTREEPYVLIRDTTNKI
jgi:hypothetical protein